MGLKPQDIKCTETSKARKGQSSSYSLISLQTQRLCPVSSREKPREQNSVQFAFLSISPGKIEEESYINDLVVKAKCPLCTHFLITWGSCCCCLLCFLAGRGGGVSFKEKGSTDVAMTSGQETDEG